MEVQALVSVQVAASCPCPVCVNKSITYVLVGFMSSTRRSKACLPLGVAAETVEELWLAVSLSRTVEGGSFAHHIDKLCLTSPP